MVVAQISAACGVGCLGQSWAPLPATSTSTARPLKEEIVRAGNYMSKVDGKSCSLEAKTVSLLISLLSTKGIYRENTNLVPTKYRFLEGAAAGHSSIVER